MAKHKLIYLLLDTTQDPSLDSESWTSGTLNKKEASKARLVLGMVGMSPSLQCMSSKYRHSWGFLGIPSPTTNSATEHGPPAHCPTFTEQSYWPGSICVGLSWDDTFFCSAPKPAGLRKPLSVLWVNLTEQNPGIIACFLILKKWNWKSWRH